jgi:hypothetical protein
MGPPEEVRALPGNTARAAACLRVERESKTALYVRYVRSTP